MSDETFAFALRAEIEAVVARYEAVVRLQREAGSAAEGELRAKLSELAAENERLRKAEGEKAAELDALRRKLAGQEAELAAARSRADKLEVEARSARATKEAYEEQFAAERRFVEAGRGLSGSLLGEALSATLGRELDATTATYGALKARGLEAMFAATVKERSRSAAQAPLLEREKTALAALAAAAGCELIAPPAGTRFSAAAMEKSATVTDPAEEGNVVECAMPGCRRAGTEGALVFPRVVVASG